MLSSALRLKLLWPGTRSSEAPTLSGEYESNELTCSGEYGYRALFSAFMRRDGCLKLRGLGKTCWKWGLRTGDIPLTLICPFDMGDMLLLEGLLSSTCCPAD